MIALWLVACAKTGTVAQPPAALQAGPRAVLEEAPPADDGEGLSIGRNEVVAYVQKVRAAVMPDYRACLEEIEASSAEDPVLVEATVTPDGKPRDVVVSRSSGDSAVDDCARKAFEANLLPEPPPRHLDASGTLELPTFAFSPP